MVAKITSIKEGTDDGGWSFRSLASALVERAKYASQLGMSFGSNRDLYEALGYVKSPTFDHYNARYQRQDIAKRIVEAYPDACWKKKPVISEKTDEETPFDKEWITLVKDFKVWHYLLRADRISGIGEYGVLLMGFKDGKKLIEPVDTATELLYLIPYTQENAIIKTWVGDKQDIRYGLPETYVIKMKQSGSTAGTKDIPVHNSRVIHIAEGLTNDDVHGTPRLKSVLNRLQDLELIAGGSAEMFWRGAFPGYGLKADSDATFGPQEKADLEDEIQNYMHNLQRYIRLQGITIESLTQQVADPSKHFQILISLIAGGKAIPQRILLGSERGNLASTQDETAWNSRVAERREDFCEPMILRPFVDKMIEVKVLTAPKEEYTVEWPDVSAPTEKDRAEVIKLKMDALEKYITSGADAYMPFEMFLRKFMDFTAEDIEQVEESFEGQEEEIDEEELEEEEE